MSILKLREAIRHVDVLPDEASIDGLKYQFEVIPSRAREGKHVCYLYEQKETKRVLVRLEDGDTPDEARNEMRKYIMGNKL